MALSPEDVRNTMFGTTRMRTGYDMDEVDSFLDVIESDLIRRTDEVQRAREAEEAMRAQNSLLHAQVRELEGHVRTLQGQLASETARADSAQGLVADGQPGSGATDRGGDGNAAAGDDLKHTEPLPFPRPTASQEPAPPPIVAVAPGSPDTDAVLESAVELVAVPVAGQVVSPRQPGMVTEHATEDEAVLSLAQQSADEIIRLALTRADVIRAEVRDMLTSQLALVPEGANHA
ncbi:MAG: DivIVA domain-containing protein [Candidatus Nanopelagicales bacterium]|nr:DivIVA domain-containing protein [Candidatus Nanopelagicales bacterium]